MTVEVRRAVLADVPLAAPLFDAYRVFYGQSSDPRLAHAFLKERLTRDESVVLLAFDGGLDGAVGFSQLYPIFSSVAARPRWLLNDLFVAPTARGRGVGRALLDGARRLATETGATGLNLATAPQNTAAQRLYESAGWERDSFLHYVFNA